MNALVKAKEAAFRAKLHPKAPKEFVSDFMLVAKHYLLEEHGELEQAKECARNDMDNAIPCYAALAGEIRS